MANVFTLTPGVNNFTGLAGDDNIFDFASSDLQSTDTITGGATGSFIDILRVTAAGTIVASQFAGVSNVEELLLSSGGNDVTLTNGVIAGSSIGYFAVVDGAGNDTVDASGVTNNVAVAFFASSGSDTFKGGNGNDAFAFNPANLTSADTVQGGAGVDNLYLNAAGTVAAGAFTNVTGIEGLVLANGTNNVTLTNGLVAGTSIGYFGVAGGTGNDTVDASAVSNSVPVSFFSNGGSDAFQGGNGNDAVVIATADLPQATLAGGAGIDNLYLSNAGTVAAAGFANVTGFEGLVLSNGTNNITLTNGFVAGTSIGYVAVAGGTGADTVDASGVTNNTPIAFYGTTGGNDTFTGGNGNDSFLFTAGTLTSSDTAVGGAGNDTLWMTTAATVTTAALAGVSGIEGVFQQSGGTFNFANGLTGTGNLAAVGSSAVDTFNGAAVTGYALTFTGNGAADALTGGSLDDTFNIPDSAFASINGNAGFDRIVLTTAAQVFDLTANAAKISNVEVISLTASAGATLSLAAADIPIINAAGNSLYVIGGGDDQVNVADTWTVTTGQTNPNLPGFTFNQYHNSTTGSNLFVADTISISITTTPDTPPVANDDAVSATEAGGDNNAVAGVDPSGNLVTGTGAAGAVADTDAEDPSTALVVVAVGTLAEGNPNNGTVGAFFSGSHGQLRLNSDGSYDYQVNQTDAAVQGLHSSADTLQDIFHYTIQDTGGAQNSATFAVTIHGANDLPHAFDDTPSMGEDDPATTFSVLSNDRLDPDSTAANTIATGVVSASGPAGTNIDATDVTAAVIGGTQIQVTLGADFQHLATGETATVTVPYTLTGDAGDTSSANLTITVNGANDGLVANDDTGSMSEDAAATLFDVRSNDTLDVDHTALNSITIGTVTASGPAGDGITGADVTTAVVGNQVQITLGADFQNLGAGETATIDVNYTLHGDQPGDTDTATLTVTVNGANDAPVAADVTFNGTNSAIGNTALVVNDATDAAPDPTGPQKTISGDLLAGATDVDTPANLFTITATTVSNAAGSLTIEADGDFTYLPAPGFTGNAVFNYTLNDNDPSGNATDTGQITINVATPKVWYVNPNAATNGDGTSDNPFNTLTQLNGVTGDGTTNDDVDGANDIIFIYGGTLSAGIVLEDGQQLIGQSQGLTVNGTALEAATGSNPLINGAVVLANGNTIDGIAFGNSGSSSAFALSGSNVGNAVITDSSINNTSGGAININGSGTGMSLTFTSVSSTNSSTNAVSFNEARGSFTANGGTLSNASGNTVNITGNGANDDLNFTYGGALSDDGNLLVNITGQTGGTKDFNGALTDGSGAGGGISLTGSSGGTVRFDGGMSLTTTTATAFNASGNTGMTLVVTDTPSTSNTLTTTTGTALNVANTTIGAEDLTFQSISAGTGAGSAGVGISLDTTGSLGGLHVTGNGAAGTGGTIQHKTGADGSTTAGIGIYLNNTSDVQLNWMQLNDFDNFAIRGNNVTDFKFDNSVISGTNGTAAGAFDEAAISFNNLLGSASISDSNIGNGFEYILKILNSSGTLNRLTIDNTDFGTNNTALGGDAVQIVASQTATVNVTVTDSSFTNAREDLFNAVATQTADMDVVFRDNTLSNNHTNKVSAASNILVFSTSTGDVTYDISHNSSTTGATGSAIAVAKGVPDSGSGGTMTGTVNANTIGVAGVVGSGSEFTGIFASALGSGTHTTAITNNTIRHYNEEGIFLKANDSLTGGNSVLNATVTGNITTEPDSLAFAGLWVVAGSGSGTENNVVNVVVGNISTAAVAGSPTGSLQNDFTNGDPANSTDVFLQESGSNSVINLSRAGSAAGTAAGVIQDDNVGTPAVVASGTVNLVNTLPPTPPPVAPLFAADGGVQAALGGAPGEHGDFHLSQAELDSVVQAAIGRWADAGASAAQLALLQNLDFAVADLAGQELGSAGSGQIVLDVDAAGHGWFIDPMPDDDLEFPNAATSTDLLTDPTLAPAGDMDLLTVLMHEMGHALGLDHDHVDAHDVMSDTLVTGERRLPDAADVAQARQETDVATPAQAPAGNGNDTLNTGANGGIQGGDPAITQAAAHVAPQGAALCDAFDFSALLASLPNGGRLEAKLEQALADVKQAFGDLFDGHHGEHPLADLAAQLRDGPLGDILHAVLSPPTAHHHADWLG